MIVTSLMKELKLSAWRSQLYFFKHCPDKYLMRSSNYNCAKSVRIWSFSGPYFPAFRLNTKRYRVSLCIQFKCGKIRTRKTQNTDTFHAVYIVSVFRRDNQELPWNNICSGDSRKEYKTP